MERKKCDLDSTHVESDLLRHPLCLVGEGHGIAVATTLVAGQLADLKFLREREGGENK